MLEAALGQASGIEIALEGVQLHHGVADGRAGGEGDAVAGVLPVEGAALQVEVEGALAAAGLDAGDAVHFRRGFQVLESTAISSMKR